ncbi:tripartite tricarboxylate transporter permease [Bosea sp. BK604]|uniref:tripartite tricarboxylate transporter permease n=1 Tax=Bosea sp. BK604 TaxID=2512180 RepID=UPI00104830F4|nr:tripartite tricarboxylate transporter permease [Bosea sp. BK604]TCR62538.1 putative tricarboxylic transport membrane protein [Bosea sp. BK604]
MDNLLLGFSTVTTPTNLLYCFIGTFLGTVIGILPGVGPLATIAILMPLSANLDVTPALIMLCGIYYGVAYGGTATSVLLRIPGEASSVVTCLDGYMMARKGRAGAALTVAAVGSFIAGTVGTVAMSYLSPPLAKIVFAFGPAQYAALMLAALAAVTYFSGGPLLKALLMVGFGLTLGCIGADPMTLAPRLTFGSIDMTGGIDLTPLAIGLFGFSEILTMARQPLEKLKIIKPPKSFFGYLPTKEEARRSVAPVARGTVLGFAVGVLPGGGAMLASFLSYALERKLCKYPKEFGQGAVEGVAGPETANNAGSSGALLPLLCMGLPSNAVSAILLTAFMMHGVAPGPAMIERQPEVFWGLIASMYIGNVMLLLLNLPLIGPLIKILDIPRAYLSPLIMLMCVIGVYASGGTTAILVAVIFGFLGYFLRKMNFDLGLLILAFVLGPILERSVRQALTISGGEISIFVTGTLSTGLLCIAALFLVLGLLPHRKLVLREDG